MSHKIIINCISILLQNHQGPFNDFTKMKWQYTGITSLIYINETIRKYNTPKC